MNLRIGDRREIPHSADSVPFDFAQGKRNDVFRVVDEEGFLTPLAAGSG